MAPRKASAAVAARKAATERAARFLAREQRLVDMAASYAETQDELDSIAERFARKREALDNEQRATESSARAAAGSAVQAMLSEGVSKDEAAERLGITRALVNEALRDAPAPQKTNTSEKPADHGPVAPAATAPVDDDEEPAPIVA